MKPFKSIGDKLKEIRGKRNQSDFAAELGIALLTYQRYERSERKPPFHVLQKAAEIGKTTVNSFLTGKETSGPGDIPGVEFLETVSIPVYSLAGAGPAKEPFTGEPVYHIPVIKRLFKPGMNGLEVSGDSMEPTLKDGSVALILPGPQEIIDNKIYVVYLRDNGIVLKRLFKGPGKLLLRSDNPSFPEMEADPKDIVIQGKVVGTMQEL